MRIEKEKKHPLSAIHLYAFPSQVQALGKFRQVFPYLIKAGSHMHICAESWLMGLQLPLDHLRTEFPAPKISQRQTGFCMEARLLFAQQPGVSYGGFLGCRKHTALNPLKSPPANNALVALNLQPMHSNSFKFPCFIPTLLPHSSL